MQETVPCAVCGELFKTIGWRHLKSHDLTTSEYKHLYPNSPLRSEAATARKKAGATRANVDRKGIPRSAEVKEQISQTKADNPTVAWNKGVPMSSERKEHLSTIRKELFKTGELIHWNSGQTTPDTVKQKIRDTTNTRVAPIRHANEQRKQRKLDAVVATNAELLANISSFGVQFKDRLNSESYNTTRRLEGILNHLEVCVAEQLTMQRVVCDVGAPGLMLYEMLCDVCSTRFDITNQYFRPNKREVREVGYCPTCHPRLYTSSAGELDLLSVVVDLLPGEDIIPNDRVALSGRELDIYIPNRNIGIEYNGLYWHREDCRSDKTHINTKRIDANKLGIRVINIFEDEWIHNRDICINRLTHILGLNTRSIHARKCSLQEIDAGQSSEFLDKHHIQGSDRSTIKCGAFHDGELVAVMTFKKTNISKGGNGSQWELSRFASAPNLKIPGIASRLFKMFRSLVETDNPIISYSDNRWNTGHLYQSLGFECTGVTPPNYWYMPPNCSGRIHRAAFMKHKLIDRGYDRNKTEKQIMNDIGYLRIYDCGSTRWEFNK